MKMEVMACLCYVGVNSYIGYCTLGANSNVDYGHLGSCLLTCSSPYIQSMVTRITAPEEVNKENVYLKHHEEEEVGIGEPPELLEEVERQEGQNVVFGGLDGIVLKKTK